MNSKIKLLYIDDDKINATLFEMCFSKNYEVFIGLSGIEGLEILENNQDIKFIISDLKMPNMNGIEFITKAKELHKEKLFAILSGQEITKNIKESLDSKLIFKYFTKPFDIQEIETAIKEIDPV